MPVHRMVGYANFHRLVQKISYYSTIATSPSVIVKRRSDWSCHP